MIRCKCGRYRPACATEAKNLLRMALADHDALMEPGRPVTVTMSTMRAIRVFLDGAKPKVKLGDEGETQENGK